MSLLLWRQFNMNPIGDRSSHATLQFKYSGQVALIGMSPNMLIGPRIDQLCGDPYTIAFAND